MTDPFLLRLRLALGGAAEPGEERPAVGGLRVFDARSRDDAPDARPTRRVIVHPEPPDGPTLSTLRARNESLLVLTHPALAAPLESGEFEGRAWVVEPIPPGRTLDETALGGGVRSVPEAIGIIRDVARALVTLHRRGLAHGALSGATVHHGSRGTIVTGLGRQPAGGVADDLFALGAIAWLLLVGHEYRATGESPSPRRLRRTIPAELDAVVARLLAADPGARPTRAEDVLERLDAVTLPAASPLDAFLDAPGRGGRTPRSRVLRWALLGLGIAALLVMLLRRTGTG